MNINKIRIVRENYYVVDNKTTCIIYWVNPVTECVCKSKGVAKCNPNDSHSPLKGKHIAQSRAKYSMWRRYVNFLEDNLYSMYENARLKHNALALKEKDHIAKLQGND